MTDERPSALKWRLYGLFRPLIRPVMRRLRIFFVGRLHDDIAELRQEVVNLRETIDRQRDDADRRVTEQIETVLADALATLAVDRDR